MRTKEFNKVSGIFIITYHILLIVGWFFYFAYHTPSAAMISVSVVLFFLTGMSITGGYHRYYSHTTYKTNRFIEAFLLFFGSMATQGSALRWAYDHRLHHAYVDTDQDPYSINKGFWYAHILWMFHKPAPIENKVVSDLIKNPLVMFQHNYYKYCMFGSNILMFLLVGWLLNDYLSAFVISWWSRLFLLHHSTWFINSLAHYWGSRTFSQEHTAVDNYIISLLTFGEGYHNYHHTFANDYRNGIKWYHYDPTKWFIWVLNKVGLTHNLKRINRYHIKERIVKEHKNELLEMIGQSLDTRKDELIAYVSKISEDILAKLAHARQLVEKYVAIKRAPTTNKDILKELKAEIKVVKKGIREDWKACKEFSKYVLKKHPG
jgi:stearoyl-CoA desaturase (Delta-9 desaturase)